MPGAAEDANTDLLRGLVLCSTSLPQELRDKLNDLAKSMGAVNRLDLTADVTHLIVGNLNTPKYKHTAKERPDIHVLKPEWIHAIRKSYIEDQDIDVDALVREHRLPAFYNLHICVTGFEDIDERQALIQKITNNGARYHGDLTREVTHLVVAKPKGAKYDRARAWSLKVVSLKWLEESLARGMALEETLYDPLMPIEDQGQGAFIRDYQRPPVLGKRQRSDVAAATKEEVGKRKMRRTTSAKLADHSQGMMTSFLSHGGEEPSEIANDQWTDTKDERPQSRTRSRSLSRISDHVNNVARPSSPPTSMHEEEPGLFSGVLCLVHGHGDKKTAKINEIIISNGGKIAQSANEFESAAESNADCRTVLILPSEWTSATRGSFDEVPVTTWRVTEWWLERCIKQKVVIDPDHDILSQPHLGFPIDGFKSTTIATSGMGNDVLHISKAVKLAGASYDEVLLPRTSILVVPSNASNTEKIAYAAKHKIPVVSDRWLVSSLQNLRRMPISDYAMGGQPRRVANYQQPSRPSSQETSAAPLYDKRKDHPAAQRLSAIRKRNFAPSLHLYQSAPTGASHGQKTESDKKGPFVEDDDDDEEETMPDKETYQVPVGQYDGQVDEPLPVVAQDSLAQTNLSQPPQPLQSIAPEVNATRRQSKSTPSGEMQIRPASSSSRKDGHPMVEDENLEAQSAEAAQANQVRLSGEIKSLLERQHSHSGPSPVEPAAKGRWRKDKRLGRAPSYTSNSSTSVSFRQHASESGPLASMVEGEAPAPSQQVTYEMPDAQEYRAKMSKKMGTRLMDDSVGTRVESPGLVRDVETGDATGVGGRVRGRQRSAKNPV